MESFLGTILMWPISWAPRGWAFCNGQIMQIAENTSLFSLIGPTYGGDGRTTFALPDLRGRIPAGAGTGPGISSRQLGQRGGAELNTITLSNLPPHQHTIQSSQVIAGGIEIQVNSKIGEEGDPNNNFLAGTDEVGYSDEAGSGTLNGLQNNLAINGQIACGTTGAGQPFSQLNPYLSLNFIIALQGIYPSRS